MPLGDDVLRLAQHPEDAALAVSVRLKLNAIERLIGLSDKIDPQSGAMSELTAGRARFDAGGMDIDSASDDVPNPESAIEWYDQRDPGTMIARAVAYGRAAKDRSWLEVSAGGSYSATNLNRYSMLELAAWGGGALGTLGNFTAMYLWADGAEAANTEDVFEVYVKTTPVLQVKYDHATDTFLNILPATKANTGDPSGVEGAIYINTYDNKIKMYADGAWRQLATW